MVVCTETVKYFMKKVKTLASPLLFLFPEKWLVFRAVKFHYYAAMADIYRVTI